MTAAVEREVSNSHFFSFFFDVSSMGHSAFCGMADDAEEIPGRHASSVGGREELKTRGGSLSSEGANAAIQAKILTPIKVLRSLERSNALILNAITTLNFIIGVHLHVKRYTRTYRLLGTCP
jgi:hypothetical protein